MEPEACAALWKAHVDGDDPTAFNRLFDALHLGLLRGLQRKFPSMPSGDIEDAALDAFLALVENPARFDPARAALPGFLLMIGARRMTDRYRKELRRNTLALDAPENEAVVAVLTKSGPASREGDALDRIQFAGRDPHAELRPEVQVWLEAVLPAPRDRDLFLMAADDRLTVEDFAALFQMQNAPIEEQRREMKRCRDRVQKRVQRDGAHLWSLIYDEPLPARFAAPSKVRTQTKRHD